MEKDVLLVDDEALVLKTLSQVFLSRGYSPHTAGDGREALEILAQRRIMVIFVDLRMPGMDGMTLCAEIKKIAPESCVYALSAFVSAFRPDQFAEAGFDGYFSKPFKVDAIIEACEDAFDKVRLWSAE